MLKCKMLCCTKVLKVDFTTLSVPRGAVPLDEREHEPAGAVVVPRADLHPRRDGRVADEAPQELLRGQETRLIPVSI